MKSRTGSLAARSWFVVVAGALAFGVACNDGAPDVSQPATVNSKNEGSLAFALTTPGNLKFDKFDYVIVGPNFSRAKSIDVSNSTTVSAVIDTIPVGSGYTLTLSGASLPPDQVICSGSAAFAITAGDVSSVPVSVQCHEPAAAPVPLPPFTPIALGVLLLAVGASARRRLQRA